MNKSLIINEIKSHLNYKTDTELADFLGVKQPTISTWRKRNTIDYELIIAKCNDIDANWLITGEGEMLASDKLPDPVEEELEIVEKKKPSLPDLFSLINDENFGRTESEDKVEKTKLREPDISEPTSERNILSNSQPLEKSDQKQESKTKKVKRIVFFYQDGTFETYEN